MRKIYLFFAILLFVGMGNFANGQVPELMYFKFDSPGNQENFAITPVGSNPAILEGQTVGATGLFGTALVGNGATSSTNRLNTGWATYLPSTGWTISFWISDISSTIGDLSYLLGDENASNFRVFAGGVAGNGNLIMRGGGLNDITINFVNPGPSVVHFVYTGTSVKTYLNGVFQNEIAQPTINITGSGPFLVGGKGSANSLATDALLDEFRMYDRILSDDEISATWDNKLADVFWTGATNTDWFTATNWEDNEGNNIVPTISDIALIPTIPSGNPNNFPIIDANNAVCRNIIIETDASLTVSSTYSLEVANAIINQSVNFTGDGDILLGNTYTSTVSFSGNITNLTINNDAGATSGSDVNIGGTLTLTNGTYTVTAGTLTLNNLLQEQKLTYMLMLPQV